MKTKHLLIAMVMMLMMPITTFQAETATATVSLQQKKNKVYDQPEVLPEFPGGMQKLMEYLRTSVKYPSEAQKKSIQGRVLVQFIVEKNGTISHLEISKATHPLLDNEALRVVESMPKWTPGKVKGKAVRTSMTLPISFKLQ
ncbi:MAG: energy transducer TonB [Prevotella sp.]|nr:energy transducer TonB [Prevotella sp.]